MTHEDVYIREPPEAVLQRLKDLHDRLPDKVTLLETLEWNGRRIDQDPRELLLRKLVYLAIENHFTTEEISKLARRFRVMTKAQHKKFALVRELEVAAAQLSMVIWNSPTHTKNIYFGNHIKLIIAAGSWSAHETKSRFALARS